MKPSGIAGAIATGAGAVGAAVPFLAPLAGPVSAVAGAVGGILSWFGFTRTTEQQTPTVVVQRPFSNLANMDVCDTSEVAALSSGNSISFDPRIMGATAQDEAAFNYLCEKWMLMGKVPWSSTDAPGDELIEFPVTPFLSPTAMDTGAYFTTGGYIGFPFQYWRADMEYMAVCPMSKFHRGVLQVSWTPSPGSPVADITNLRFNQILDMGTCQEWRFDVGYVSREPMLENIPHLFGAGPILSSAGANGMVSITVANPLTAQTETASTNIFIFARCKSNATFSVPRNYFQKLDNDGSIEGLVDLYTGFRLQSGALGDEIIPMRSFTLVPGNQFPVKEVCVGEVVDSVRALMQKFSIEQAMTRNCAQAKSNVYVFPHIPPYPITNQVSCLYGATEDTTQPYFTWAGYYAPMYVGVAGSVRYKIVNNSDEPIPIGLYAANNIEQIDCTSAIITSSVSSLSPIWVPSKGLGVEVTIPYYYNRKYINSAAVFTAAAIMAKTGRVNVLYLPDNSGSSSYQSITAYTAYGPDLRFHMFRCLPRIIAATADPVEWSYDLTPPG
jgi:hypothetical protein